MKKTYTPTAAQIEAAARAMCKYIEGGSDAKWFQYAYAAELGLKAAASA